MSIHQPARLLLLTVAAMVLAACASGSAIVTGTTRSPIGPSQVRLYVEPPVKFDVIGLVSASSDAGLTEQGSVNYAVEELKRRAAKLGANGVLLRSTGTDVDAFGDPVKTVQGQAIYVSEP
jgi:type IV pilus biogenesis protein CpaD/CtpE